MKMKKAYVTKDQFVFQIINYQSSYKLNTYFPYQKDITSKIMENSNRFKSFVYEEKSYYNVQTNDFAKLIMQDLDMKFF